MNAPVSEYISALLQQIMKPIRGQSWQSLIWQGDGMRNDCAPRCVSHRAGHMARSAQLGMEQLLAAAADAAAAGHAQAAAVASIAVAAAAPAAAMEASCFAASFVSGQWSSRN
jgi:hypothetical protein